MVWGRRSEEVKASHCAEEKTWVKAQLMIIMYCVLIENQKFLNGRNSLPLNTPVKNLEIFSKENGEVIEKTYSVKLNK